MKKSQRTVLVKKNRLNKKRKGLRPNPAKSMPMPLEWSATMPWAKPSDDGLGDLLSGTVGNMAVNAALRGCTLNEKLLIAAVLPTFVQIIRTGPEESIKKAVDKLHKEESDADTNA